MIQNFLPFVNSDIKRIFRQHSVTVIILYFCTNKTISKSYDLKTGTSQHGVQCVLKKSEETGQVEEKENISGRAKNLFIIDEQYVKVVASRYRKTPLPGSGRVSHVPRLVGGKTEERKSELLEGLKTKSKLQESEGKSSETCSSSTHST